MVFDGGCVFCVVGVVEVVFCVVYDQQVLYVFVVGVVFEFGDEFCVFGLVEEEGVDVFDGVDVEFVSYLSEFQRCLFVLKC